MGTIKKIGDIQLFAEISQGAEAVVYKGYQAELERTVLVKVLRPELCADESLIKAFHSEAKLLAKIQHPNVVNIFGSGQSEGRFYFTAEFIEGLTLRELIERAKIPPDLCWFILKEIAKGLQAVHSKNIFHRDIKPENVLISCDGQVKITDFGLASLQREQPTAVNGSSGTLAYFSPEQIKGEDVSERSDIFSLGVTFYEMLTGSRPFQGKNTDALFKAILSENPAPYLKKAENIPAGLQQICLKMLKKSPEQRTQNCDQLLKALENLNALPEIKNSDLKLFIAKPEKYSPKKLSLNSAPKVEPVKSRSSGRFIFPTAGIVFLALVLYVFRQGIFEVNPVEPKSNSPAAALTGEKPGSSTQTEPVQTNLVLKKNSDSLNLQKAPVQQPAPTAIEVEDAPENIVTMTSQPAFGFLNITCKPWAKISVDGDSIGITPLKRPVKLSAGSHSIVLGNKDFPEFRMSINIYPDETLQIEHSFWSMVGRLKLEIQPWAEVYIDGEYVDTVPPQARPIILKPGEHLLLLKHPALGEWETKLSIKAEENLSLQFNLNNLIKK